jgi:hypothetical protein
LADAIITFLAARNDNPRRYAFGRPRAKTSCAKSTPADAPSSFPGQKEIPFQRHHTSATGWARDACRIARGGLIKSRPVVRDYLPIRLDHGERDVGNRDLERGY